MEFHPLQQPHEITEREREDAMGAYLMMFAAVAIGLPLPIINLIASIIYYFVNRKKSRFIHFHSLQALLSQIPTTVINWVAVIWALTIFIRDDWEANNTFWAYLIFSAACTVIYFVISIIAAYKARQGKMYYFLLFGKMAYQSVYRIKPGDSEAHESINKPPF
jgi:uncharacterized Tic20 family protein